MNGYIKKWFRMEDMGYGNLLKVVRNNGGDERFIVCLNGECVFKLWRLEGVFLDVEFSDCILYFMFNFMNFKIKIGI